MSIENLKFSIIPSQLEAVLFHLLNNKASGGNDKPQGAVLVHGAPGIGKTEMVWGLAKKWKSRVVALHLPQYDPSDLKGIPVCKTDGTIVWKPTSYLPQMHKEIINANTTVLNLTMDFKYAVSVQVLIKDSSGKLLASLHNPRGDDENPHGFSATVKLPNSVQISVPDTMKEKELHITLVDNAIIFLDELTAAVPEVQTAALQLCHDRRVGEYDVPPGVPILAAGNRESDGAFVNTLSSALANRFCHVTLVPSVDDYINWAINNGVRADVIGYIKWKGSEVLFNYDNKTMNNGDFGFPSPRSWTNLSHQLDDSIEKFIQNVIISGYIGQSLSTDFIAYRNIINKLPDSDAILDGKPVVFELEKKEIGAMYAVVTALCLKLRDRFNQYYVESNGPKNQSEKWNIARDSFLQFVDKHIKEELTVYAIHLLNAGLGVKFIALGQGPYAQKFSDKYINYMR